MKPLNEFLNEGVKYDKITVRSSKFDKYVVITPKGDVQWTKDDGKAHEFDSVEDGVPVANMVGFQEMDVKGYIPVGLLNMYAASNIFKFFQTTMNILNAK